MEVGYNWCENCRLLQKELKTREAIMTQNFNILKKKIISTEIIIVNYNKKLTECSGYNQKIKSMSSLLEQLDNDLKQRETELSKALQELEPLRIAKEELSQQIKMKNEASEVLEEKLVAAEQLHHQLEVALKNNEKEYENQKSVIRKLKQQKKTKQTQNGCAPKNGETHSKDHIDCLLRVALYFGQTLEKKGWLPARATAQMKKLFRNPRKTYEFLDSNLEGSARKLKKIFDTIGVHFNDDISFDDTSFEDHDDDMYGDMLTQLITDNSCKLASPVKKNNQTSVCSPISSTPEKISSPKRDHRTTTTPLRTEVPERTTEQLELRTTEPLSTTVDNGSSVEVIEISDRKIRRILDKLIIRERPVSPLPPSPPLSASASAVRDAVLIESSREVIQLKEASHRLQEAVAIPVCNGDVSSDLPICKQYDGSSIAVLCCDEINNEDINVPVDDNEMSADEMICDTLPDGNVTESVSLLKSSEITKNETTDSENLPNVKIIDRIGNEEIESSIMEIEESKVVILSTLEHTQRTLNDNEMITDNVLTNVSSNEGQQESSSADELESLLRVEDLKVVTPNDNLHNTTLLNRKEKSPKQKEVQSTDCPQETALSLNQEVVSTFDELQKLLPPEELKPSINQLEGLESKDLPDDLLPNDCNTAKETEACNLFSKTCKRSRKSVKIAPATINIGKDRSQTCTETTKEVDTAVLNGRVNVTEFPAESLGKCSAVECSPVISEFHYSPLSECKSLISPLPKTPVKVTETVQSSSNKTDSMSESVVTSKLPNGNGTVGSDQHSVARVVTNVKAESRRRLCFSDSGNRDQSKTEVVKEIRSDTSVMLNGSTCEEEKIWNQSSCFPTRRIAHRSVENTENMKTDLGRFSRTNVLNESLTREPKRICNGLASKKIIGVTSNHLTAAAVAEASKRVVNKPSWEEVKMPKSTLKPDNTPGDKLLNQGLKACQKEKVVNKPVMNGVTNSIEVPLRRNGHTVWKRKRLEEDSNGTKKQRVVNGGFQNCRPIDLSISANSASMDEVEDTQPLDLSMKPGRVQNKTEISNIFKPSCDASNRIKAAKLPAEKLVDFSTNSEKLVDNCNGASFERLGNGTEENKTAEFQNGNARITPEPTESQKMAPKLKKLRNLPNRLNNLIGGTLNRLCHCQENLTKKLLENSSSTVPVLSAEEYTFVQQMKTTIKNLCAKDRKKIVDQTCQSLIDTIFTQSCDEIFGLASLCRVYCAVCLVTGDLERPRILCFDLMYRLTKSSGFLIANMVGVWKRILCLNKDNGKTNIPSCLLSTMQFLLSQMSTDVLLSMQLKKLLVSSFGNVNIASGDCDKFVNNLLSQLRLIVENEKASNDAVHDIMRSVTLVAAVKGWTWTNDCLVREQLWPRLKAWYEEDKAHSSSSDGSCKSSGFDRFAANNLRMLGFVCRNCPIDSSEPVLRVMGLMKALLDSVKSTPVSSIVQEAAADAILMLHPFAVEMVEKTLECWIAAATNVQFSHNLNVWINRVRKKMNKPNISV